MHALADTVYSTRCNCSVGTEVHLKAGLLLLGIICLLLFSITYYNSLWSCKLSFTPLITSLFILNCSCVESQTEKYVNRQWEPFWTLQRTPKLVLGLGFLVEFKYFLVSVPVSQILNSFRVIKSLTVIDTCTVEEDQGECNNYCFPDLPFGSLQAIPDFNERKARVNYSH